MIWTQENIDLVKTYLQNNLTKKQIMAKMNCTFDSLDHAIRRYDLSKFKVPSKVADTFSKNLELDLMKDENFEKSKEEAKLRWTIAKSKLSPNKKGLYKSYLVTSDHHIPHHDESSIKAIIKLMDDVKFDGNVILGDYLDYGCISHWTKNKRRTLETQRLKNDYIIGNSLLDEMDKRLPKNCDKLFMKGNHEVWVDDLLEEMPSLEGLVEPETNLKLAERGYKVYPYNDVVQLAKSKLNLTHGIYAGTNPLKKHLEDLKVNIMFGHTHTMGMMLSSSIAREIAFSGYNIGCLANLAPDYMRGRPHAWQHGFAIVHIYENGFFEVQLIRILNGQFIFNGKVYSGRN